MKLNNKFILASAVVGSALTITSCSDVLDVDRPSSQDSEFVFMNTEYATTALNGVYALFGEDPFTSRMSCVWMQNTDVEAYTPNSGKPSGSHRSDIWGLQGGLDVSFGDIYKAWNNNFQAIEQANNVIQGCENSSVASDAEMLQIKGEAVCLKAWRYLMLCNYWGDVPYYDSPSKFGDELDKPKTDKNIIYSRCLQQLVDVEGDMKFSDVNTGGTERCNRDFALGLIAKMALFRAGYGMTADGTMKKADDYLDTSSDDLAVKYTVNGTEKVARTCADYYQMAKDYCQKLISLKGRTLRSDYESIFTDLESGIVANNDEILYQVAFVVNRGGDVGWCIGVPNTGTCTYGNTTAQVGFNPIYYMTFSDNDIRRDITCTKYSHDNDTIKPATITALGVGKFDRYEAGPNFSLGSSSSKGTGVNWPVMRYSEVLLMLAEAENELNGPTALAQEALTQVRARAFAKSPDYAGDVTNYVAAAAADKAKFFNAIVDERAWEFGGECVRKWDLQRWNIYGQKVNEAVRNMNAFGIACNPVLMEDAALVAQYPEVAKYQGCANILYYNKEAKAKDKKKLTWINDKYSYTDSIEIEARNGVNQVNWGKAMVKSVTTYIYNNKTYTASPTKTVNKEAGTVTYKFNDDTEVTVNEGEYPGITKKVVYQCSDQAARLYRGYTGDTGIGSGDLCYLLPIGSITMSSSSVLTNDGYGFANISDSEGKNYELKTVETEFK